MYLLFCFNLIYLLFFIVFTDIVCFQVFCLLNIQRLLSLQQFLQLFLLLIILLIFPKSIFAIFLNIVCLFLSCQCFQFCFLYLFNLNTIYNVVFPSPNNCTISCFYFETISFLWPMDFFRIEKLKFPSHAYYKYILISLSTLNKESFITKTLNWMTTPRL